MCGIFGEISSTSISNRNLRLLSNHARRRGVDSSGIVYFDNYLHTDKNVKFAMSFKSREGANMYVDMFLDNIDYLTEDDLEVVEEWYG